MGKILYYLLVCVFLFLIGSWVTVMVKSCSNTELPSSISDATKSVTKGTKRLANKAKDGAGTVINKAKGAAGKAKAGLDKAGDTVKNTAKNAKDKVVEKAGDAKDLLADGEAKTDDNDDAKFSKDKLAKADEAMAKLEREKKAKASKAEKSTTTAKGGSTTAKGSTSTKSATPKSYSSGSAYKYMVIAGSYTGETNAKNAVKKLKRLGYDKAEVIRFYNSEYYSVCAGRYSGMDSATKLKDKLVSSTSFGDTYVKTRKERK